MEFLETCNVKSVSILILSLLGVIVLSLVLEVPLVMKLVLILGIVGRLISTVETWVFGLELVPGAHRVGVELVGVARVSLGIEMVPRTLRMLVLLVPLISHVPLSRLEIVGSTNRLRRLELVARPEIGLEIVRIALSI